MTLAPVFRSPEAVSALQNKGYWTRLERSLEAQREAEEVLRGLLREVIHERYLDAVGRAVDWYQRSQIAGAEGEGVWARFYELETNVPLYFTRTYELVYTDDDLPVHSSFKGNYGVRSRVILT